MESNTLAGTEKADASESNLQGLRVKAEPREYKVSLYIDMGHFMTEPGLSELPKEIYNFVYKKARNKIEQATDKNGLGCLFYYLKPGLLNEWRYIYRGNTVIIDYSKVGTFDPDHMQHLDLRSFIISGDRDPLTS